MLKHDLPEYKGLTKKDREILRIPPPQGGFDQSREAQKGRKAVEEKAKKGERPEWEG